MSKRPGRRRNVIIPHILPKKPENTDCFEDREFSYSNSVLIGNWFENRFAHEEDKRAITPGIYGNSDCTKDASVYHSDYKQHINMQPNEDYTEFTQWKQCGFRNYLNGKNSNIYFCSGDQFINNLTTLKDIMYRIKPEQDVNCHVLVPKKEKVNEDYLRSFGNSTQTGLLQWLRCKKYRDENTPVDVSHYKNNFKPIKINKPIVRYKGTQRKTSLTGED